MTLDTLRGTRCFAHWWVKRAKTTNRWRSEPRGWQVTSVVQLPSVRRPGRIGSGASTLGSNGEVTLVSTTL